MMIKLRTVALLALLGVVATTHAADIDDANAERDLIWEGFIEEVDSFPSAAPSPAPSERTCNCENGGCVCLPCSLGSAFDSLCCVRLFVLLYSICLCTCSPV